jgi:flagellum-specific ATP synthase
MTGDSSTLRSSPMPSLRRFDRSQLLKAFSHLAWDTKGKVCDVVGTVVEANLPSAQLGTVVSITVGGPKPEVLGEVVGFKKDRALVLPLGHLGGIAPGCMVTPLRMFDRVRVGSHLLGRIVDPMLEPLSGNELSEALDTAELPIDRDAPNPMARKRIEHTLGLGIRVMDGLLTFGEGQRVGIMAGSGVGKSVMMGMIAKGSSADINVIALIGERGREVREFLERDLGPEGLARSVVVVVTSDQSPLMKVRGAKVATSIAEYFSGKGKRVLLMMDSLTRVAMAQREIGAAIQEPPTTKGYPPSTFALLPRLLERCGPQTHGNGSISGLYTVLVDGDDFNDPIPDAARSILDGHVNLSRKLAAKGHFPAIEVTTSASRVMYDIVSKEHWQMASRIRSLLGVWQENLDYIQIGSYQPGSNPLLDQAIQLMPAIERYLKQDVHERTTTEDALRGLMALTGQSPGGRRDDGR